MRHSRHTRRWLWLALVPTFAAVTLSWFADPRGLRRETFSEPGLRGDVVDERIVSGIDEYATRGPGLPTRLFSMRWTGYWDVPAGPYEVWIAADDAAALEIDASAGSGQPAQRVETRGLTLSQSPVVLGAGPHRLSLTFEQGYGATALQIRAALSGNPPAPLSPSRLFLAPPTTWTRAIARFLDVAWWLVAIAWACWGLSLVWARARHFACEAGAAGSGLASVAPYLRETWPRLRESRGARIATRLALTVIVLYGAVLRVQALSDTYGPLNHPGWAQRLDFAAHQVSARFAPAGLHYPRVETPYVGSDAINYIKYAREMTAFYQAHVREPVFLAVTRAWLVVLDDQDVAVSFASTTFSILLVPATYLLARAAFGPLAGLFAALFIAIEATAIEWGSKGMRDDASSVFVALTAWSLVRLLQKPGGGVAIAGGVLGALASLTRITSIGLWLPGLALATVLGPASTRGRRLRLALVNLAVGAALVTPYLYNCWRTFGDPLYAVNYHTVFYRARENVAYDQPQSAGAYVLAKLRESPIQTSDTAFYGLVMYPFTSKWTGYAPWGRSLGPLLAGCALVGIFASTCRPAGRLLLAVLLLSTLPFAVTWNVPGGGEWRFTTPAYAFYLAAAGWTLAGIVSLSGAALLGHLREQLVHWRADTSARCLVAAGLMAATIGIANAAGPWFSMRETLQLGRTVVVRPAQREDVVLSRGWDVLPRGGCARALGPQQLLKLPLAGEGPWRIDVHLASDQGSSDIAAPVEVSAGPGARPATVLLRPDDRNQVARVEVPRADTFLTEVTVTGLGAPGADRDGRPVPPYSLCEVDIVSVGPR